jgi:hypothetical protein
MIHKHPVESCLSRVPKSPNGVFAVLFCSALFVGFQVGCTDKLPPPKPPLFVDSFDRAELGGNWKSTAPDGTYRIENGQLVVKGARNHPLWLTIPLPTDAVIELDAMSTSSQGDLKFEAWGDGQSSAKTVSYTSTGYVFIHGGWQNRLTALCRQDEHADDRKTRSDLRVVPHKTYHLVATRKDQLLRFYIDGKLALEMDDLSPLSGPGHAFFAFNNWETEVHFDNLVVRPY